LGRSGGRRLVLTGKKGGLEVGRGRKGNGTNYLVLTDGNDTPLSSIITAANVSEVHAIETLVDECRTSRLPKRLLYDKAADADWLRESLATRGVELICPHRSNRRQPPLQDGRSLRRYKRRYQIERSISWLQNCRRLITRWEWYDDLFEGFVHLACLYTILQRL
jgi:transposase